MTYQCGKFEVQEISTLSGYVLDDKIYTVNFEKEDNTTKEYTYTLDCQNLMTTIEFSKIDIENNYIENCDLELYQIEENGELTLIDSWKTTKEPHIIKGIKVDAKLVLKEKSAASEFVIASDINCNVKNSTEVQKFAMVDKQVEISKIDIAGNEVVGAKLQVLDMEHNILDEWTSSLVPHKVSNLRENETFILHEEISVDGFVKATDITFTVTSEDKQTQKIQMIDKIVEISKTDIGGNEVIGAKLQVIDMATSEILDEWISSELPHRVSNLEENKSYLLHEEVSVDGFVKATDQEFTVSTDKQTQSISMIDKVVLISKTDLVTGKEVEGAELVVTDENDNIVDQWFSSKDGPHAVSGLEEGKTYVLTEKTVPYRIRSCREYHFYGIIRQRKPSCGNARYANTFKH